MMNGLWQLAQLHTGEEVSPQAPEVHGIPQTPQQSRGMVRNRPTISLLKKFNHGEKIPWELSTKLILELRTHFSEWMILSRWQLNN